MINVKKRAGLEGEFRVFVKGADGSIRVDTGKQKNLILDNFLNWIQLLSPPMRTDGLQSVKASPYDPFYYCLIGSGTDTPQKNQTNLTSEVARTHSSDSNFVNIEYPDTDKHEGYVKLTKTVRYVFTGIENENITEVGIAGQCYSETIGGQYRSECPALFTRALITDSHGSPVSITVLPGETLFVEYTLNLYIDITPQTGQIELTINDGVSQTSKTFNYRAFISDIRQQYAFNLPWTGNYTSYSYNAKSSVSSDLSDSAYTSMDYTTNDSDVQRLLGQYKSSSNNNTSWSASYQNSEHSISAGKHKFDLTFGINAHNHPDGIRLMRISIARSNYVIFYMNCIFSEQTTGTGIPKTDKQQFNVSVELSYDRWSG